MSAAGRLLLRQVAAIRGGGHSALTAVALVHDATADERLVGLLERLRHGEGARSEAGRDDEDALIHEALAQGERIPVAALEDIAHDLDVTDAEELNWVADQRGLVPLFGLSLVACLIVGFASWRLDSLLTALGVQATLAPASSMSIPN